MLRKQRAVLALVLMLTVLLTGCFKSETVVTKVDPDPKKNLDKLDGVHYSLPRTVVKVDVPFKRTEEKPGPLEKFTPCFFPADIANERVREKSFSYSIEDPTFAYRVEPDPTQHFIVSVKGGLFEKKSLLLDYLPGGIISKGTAESTNEALEFTLKAIKTGTSIVAGFAGIPKVEAGFTDAADKANEGMLTPEEKEALNCFGRKYLVAVQEQAEAEKELGEAQVAQTKATTPEEKKATQEALKKAEAKVEKAKKAKEAAKKEREAVEDYLRQEAGERQKIQNAEDERRKIQDAIDKARSGGVIPSGSGKTGRTGRSRRSSSNRAGNNSNGNNSNGNTSAGTGNINGESDGTGTNTNSQGTNGSGNAQNEGNRNSNTQASTLSQRTPDENDSDDLKAERLLDEYQRSKLTFEAIKKLEEKRIALVAGETGTDAIPTDALKEMLAQIDKALEVSKNLFFGSKAEKPWTAKFEYTPDANLGPVQTSRPLLWFAKEGDSRGLCKTPESIKQGVIIPDKFISKKCGTVPAVMPTGMDVVYLYLDKNMDDEGFRGKLARVQQKFDDEKKKRGWYYRVPAKATIVLKVGNPSRTAYAMGVGSSLPPPISGDARVPNDLAGAEEVRRNVLDIAQLGVTVSAPASGAGRTNQSTIEYDDFGALKNFKYASDPLLQQSYLDEVQGTAQTIIDAKTKSNEAKKAKADAAATAAAAAAAANDPLNKMKVELETLQIQNQINEERKKLEGEGEEEEEEEGTP